MRLQRHWPRWLSLLLLLTLALAPAVSQAAPGSQPPTPPAPPVPAQPALNFPRVPTGCVRAFTSAGVSDVQPILDFHTITSTIDVENSFGYLWSVGVTTNLTHTASGDLAIHLISPAGTDVLLTYQNGGTAANVFNGTFWNDQAALGTPSRAVTDYTFTSGVPVNQLSPQEPLGALRGENPNGLWTLRVSDLIGGDQGQLQGWGLIISALNHAPDVTRTAVLTDTAGDVVPDQGTLTLGSFLSNVPDPITALTVTTLITHARPATVNAYLIAPDGVTVTLTTGNGKSDPDAFAGTTWDDRAARTDLGRVVTTYPYTFTTGVTPLTPEEPLSKLLGRDATGLWQVEMDDTVTDGHTGALGGFTLGVQTAHCFPNLSANLQPAVSFPRVGLPLTIAFTSTNTSMTATQVTMTTNLDPRLRFQSAGAAPWGCQTPPLNTAGGTVTCTLASQGQNTTAQVPVTVTVPLTPQIIPVSATLGLAETDTDPTDNLFTGQINTFAGSANHNPWDLDHNTAAVVDGGQDAFDTFGLLRAQVFSGASLLADTTPAGLGLVFTGPGQRWTTSTPQTFGGVRIARQLDGPPDQNWLRYLDSFTNLSGAPLTLRVAWGGNLGSDNLTFPVATSSGDLILDPTDTWAVTQQGAPGTPAGDAVVGYAFRGPGDTSYLGPDILNANPMTTTFPATGTDELGHVFAFNLAPGATKRLAYFLYRGLAEGQPGPVDCQYYGGCVTPATGSQSALAASTVAALVAHPPLCDLSAPERATVVNWPALASVCPTVFLPAVQR